MIMIYDILTDNFIIQLELMGGSCSCRKQRVRFTPISYEQVIEIMNHKKPFKVVDHHNREDE